MYRLTYFKATNVLGFISGMGKKTFELDLSEYTDKNVFCIVGPNACGKSTLQSMIHPWHTPSDKRSKFIVPGKEGSLVREYTSDDGTSIITKCVYLPKSDDSDGHNVKCYFKISYPNGEETELNENGNVKSYESLLYTYFGINKDFISFASYNTAVTGIVSMTDTERKNSVNTLIPNTSRFENAYNIINDKYRELRNLIRNLSQKILALRDEDSLRSDLKRITHDLNEYTQQRESAIKKAAKIDGRLKELCKGKDIKELIQKYNSMISNIYDYDQELKTEYHDLITIYRELGIVPDANSITFDGIDDIPDKILRFEKKITKSDASLEEFENQYHRLEDSLFQTKKELAENESMLFSLQTQDIGELIQTRKNYETKLASLQYTQHKDDYANMSYNEIIQFSRIVSMIDGMVQALYDEYGQLVTDYFSYTKEEYESHVVSEQQKLSAHIISLNNKRDLVYREIIEKEQYKKLESILSQRPKSCTIDSCPFIANALKWKGVTQAIQTLKASFDEINVQIDEDSKQQQDIQSFLAIHESADKLVQYIMEWKDSIEKYLNITTTDLLNHIKNGTWGNVLDVMKLKNIAVILSEKDLYQKITTELIPSVDHEISMAKLYGTNRQLLKQQNDRLHEQEKLYQHEMKELTLHIQITSKVLSRSKKKLSQWKTVYDLIRDYQTIMSKRIETEEIATQQNDEIQIIKELNDKSKELKVLISSLTESIQECSPKQEQLKMDLLNLDALKTEKATIERDFVVVDIMKSIIQPGKGIRKELINIYMYDIFQTANQLLLNTFDGNLYLQEFNITDKEFIIPYVYNGSIGTDIAYASSSQQSTISSAISLAIISKLIDKYGILTYDEIDAPLSAENKSIFIDILVKQMRYIGINQAFLITHSPEFYEPHDCCFIQFSKQGVTIK